ncbi:MAG TPA: peptidylprolyl isomerase [Ardenticatenaceae bacterium]
MTTKRPVPVKQVTRTEMQGEKNWWTQPGNLAVVGILLLVTIIAIYAATQMLGPADEAADQRREQPSAAGATGATGQTSDVLVGSLPAATSQTATGKDQWSTPFPMLIDPSRDYYATIQTSKGPIEIDLFEDEAPMTVNNFVALAESGFYNGVLFHRVIPNFMAQGGDPLGTGTGGPGYSIEDEFSPNLRHDQPGTLSMANAGPNTGGSQFFITYGPTPHLDAYDEAGQLRPCGQPQVSCHAVFGRVTTGLETAQALTPAGPEAGGGGAPDVIETITISTR